MSKVLLVDGHNLAWRLFFNAKATDKNFKNKTIENANELEYGFINTLGSIVAKQKIDKIVIAFDSEANWRHTVDSSYKEGRVSHANEKSRFGAQILRLPSQLRAFGVETITIPGLEADDIIVHLLDSHELRDSKKVILTKDKDLLAFVRNDVDVLIADTKDLITTGNYAVKVPSIFKTNYPLSPQEVPVFRAFVGDEGDNIKGVSNISTGYAAEILLTLREQGKHLTGPKQSFEDIRQVISGANFPPHLAKLLTPQALRELESAYNIVQPYNAPKPLQDKALTYPLVFPQRATNKELIAYFDDKNYKQFATYIRTGASWGFNPTQPLR